MVNAWISYVKEYASKNNLTYPQALKSAGASYKKVDKPAKVAKSNTQLKKDCRLKDKLLNKSTGKCVNPKVGQKLSQLPEGVVAVKPVRKARAKMTAEETKAKARKRYRLKKELEGKTVKGSKPKKSDAQKKKDAKSSGFKFF